MDALQNAQEIPELPATRKPLNRPDPAVPNDVAVRAEAIRSRVQQSGMDLSRPTARNSALISGAPNSENRPRHTVLCGLIHGFAHVESRETANSLNPSPSWFRSRGVPNPDLVLAGRTTAIT
jgi:hypothetical protein